MGKGGITMHSQYSRNPRKKLSVSRFGQLDFTRSTSLLSCNEDNLELSSSSDELEEYKDSGSSPGRIEPGGNGIIVSDKRQCHVDMIAGWERASVKESIEMMSLREFKEEQSMRMLLKKDTMFRVRLVEVVGPDKFCLEVISDPPNDRHGFECETLDEHFQRCYSAPDSSEKYKMRTMKPCIGQLYAVHAEKLKKWQRIEVIEIDFETLTVSAKSLDYFEDRSTLKLSFDSLYELHPYYGNKLRVEGRLGGIDPPTPATPDNGVWSPECAEHFKGLVEEKTFLATFYDIAYKPEDDIICASIFLYQNSEENGNKVCINALLVKSENAISLGRFR